MSAEGARATVPWQTVANPPSGSPTDMNVVLRVLERREESTDCLSLLFERPRGFDFDPGDWIDIRFPTAELSVGRTYSLSSAPSEADLRITFKRGISAFKRALESTRTGDTLLITQYGSSGFRRVRRTSAVMIAGGIGMAPFRSMIRDALDEDRPPAIDLIYVNRTADFPFEAELREWQHDAPSFVIQTQQTGSGQRLNRRSLGRLIAHPELACPSTTSSGRPRWWTALASCSSASASRTIALRRTASKVTSHPGLGRD